MAVYIVEAVGYGLVKIGSASNVLSRIATLQTACFAELKLFRVFVGGFREERLLHRHFASCRHRGEWFLAAPVFDEIDAVDLRDESALWDTKPITIFGALARIARQASVSR